VWIALTLLPVANVLDQETRFAERYAFLPILGGAAILATLGSALGRSRTLRRGLAVAGVVMVAGLGAISVGRGAYFRDDLAFHLRWADVNGHDSRSFFNLGVAFTERRMLKRGMDAYRHTLALDPENGGALNNLAWLLATAVDDELRDGKKAVELAGMLARSDGGQDLLVLDTLAAAYAEDGAFEAAVETASRAVALARAIGDRQLTREMQHRLKLYERKVPYRDR
jgi:tetratricopeptide (TPR) repeat protein